MGIHLRNFIKYFALLLYVTMFATSAHASGIVASQKAELKVVKLDNQGQEVITYEPASLVSPGETVKFTIEFENKHMDAVDDAVLIMPIPGEMVYLTHESNSNVYQTKLSYDDAKKFWGEGAFPEGYDPDTMVVTHIKWEFIEPIIANEAGSVSAYARLK